MFFAGVSIVSAYVPVLVLFALAFVLRALIAVLRHPRIKGAMGECLVSQCLRHGLGRTAVVLDNVFLPLEDGTTTQIDHVVVCSQGVFCVETKNYSGWIFGDEKAREWTQVLYRQKHRFQNPIRQNFLHVRTLADTLRLEDGLVKGVVVFIGGCRFKTKRPHGVVFPAEAAAHIRASGPVVLSVERIGALADGISAFAATVTREQMARHVENLRRRRDCRNERFRATREGAA